MARLNDKVAHRALDLFMPQQELYCSQIVSAPVNKGRLGSAQRMRPEARVQPNAGNPLVDEPGVLSRRYRAIPTATAAEEELIRLLVGGCDVAVYRLSGLFRHFEPGRLARLLLAHRRSIDHMTMRSNVFDLQPDDVTSSEFAVDSW